jgi:OTU domain-containing protein 5
MTVPKVSEDDNEENCGAAEEEKATDSLTSGQLVDVLDLVGKWCEAQVIDVDHVQRRVLITYIYWMDTFNEWIPVDSNRIQPDGSHTYRLGGLLQLGHRVEALDTTGNWIEAEVIAVSASGVRIHYKNWAAKFDEDLPFGTERIRPYGRQKRLQKNCCRIPSLCPVPRKRVTSLQKQAQQDRTRKLPPTSDAFARYILALRTLNFIVVPMEGDGNCLFRSVAHQVYGEEQLHALVRAKCCEYMEVERIYFEPFVEGDMADFFAYLEQKRQLGVWGDDPEIQALCELYDRPCELWGYCPVAGAKKLRTFHEASHHRSPPIRVSYYGGGHYDSIIGPDHMHQIMRTPPGAAEDTRIALSGQWLPGGIEEGKLQSDVLATEQSQLHDALQASREDFDRLDEIDLVFEDQTQMVISSDAALLLAADEERHVAQALALSADPELRCALDASARHADGEGDLEAALAMSMPSEGDGDLNAALAMSLGGFPDAQSDVFDEDEELQQAILLSQQGIWR